jgi:ATP-dependent helicase YprA (DUF1998 family)
VGFTLRCLTRTDVRYFQNFQFYQHQAQAFVAAQSQKPYVLTTGTGSGKSLSYVVPIIDAAIPDRLRGRALGGLSTSMFLGQFLSPIVTQPLTNSMSLGGTYALTGSALVIVALGFAVFKSQVRSLTHSHTV